MLFATGDPGGYRVVGFWSCTLNYESRFTYGVGVRVRVKVQVRAVLFATGDPERVISYWVLELSFQLWG